jgi:hypothetical protein
MYVDKLIHISNGKNYAQYFLRESKREGKKTILNITQGFASFFWIPACAGMTKLNNVVVIIFSSVLVGI